MRCLSSWNYVLKVHVFSSNGAARRCTHYGMRRTCSNSGSSFSICCTGNMHVLGGSHCGTTLDDDAAVLERSEDREESNNEPVVELPGGRVLTDCSTPEEVEKGPTDWLDRLWRPCDWAIDCERIA